MVYNLHITTDEAGALLELSASLADQLEGVVTTQSFSPTGKFQMTVFQHFIKRCPSVGRKSYSQRFNM